MKNNILWLGAAALLIIVITSFGVIVVTAQRMSANDLSIQFAEDAAASLNNGDSPASLSKNRIGFEHSLAPFIVIYDKQGDPIAGTGYLNGVLPAAPLGILTAAQGHGYHAVTWQPQADTRVAAVTVSARNYYVLGGQSLKEVELQENTTYELAGAALCAALFAFGMLYIFMQRFKA